MSSAGSVSALLAQLRSGEDSALGQLHERYWPWLVGLARAKLRGARLAVADEEDVAQEAFWSFYRRLKAGGTPRLANRQDFLALVTTITACKAVNQIQHEVGVQKRSGRPIRGEAASFSLATAEVESGRTPEEEAILNDWYRHFLEGLPVKLRDFAELYLAGCSQREIAVQLHCGLRTVERKVALILARWQEMGADSVNPS